MFQQKVFIIFEFYENRYKKNNLLIKFEIIIKKKNYY